MSAPVPKTSETSAVRIRELHRGWTRGERHHRVLDGVNLDLPEGAFASITGRSGTGKTTLLQIIGGLDRQYRGSVEVLGTDLASLDDAALSRLRGLQCGFIFQHFNLLPHLSVLQNVLLPTAFHRSATDPERAARDLLARVGLGDRVEDRPALLSGGQQQRVAIARALVQGARLILCDEPTGSLDLETGNDLMDLFRDLNEERGTTFIIVTHEPHIVARTRLRLNLENGQLREVDP